MECPEVKSHDIAYFGGENTQMWVIFQYFWGGKVLTIPIWRRCAGANSVVGCVYDI
jgi:hypothetical protein